MFRLVALATFRSCYLTKINKTTYKYKFKIVVLMALFNTIKVLVNKNLSVKSNKYLTVDS